MGSNWRIDRRGLLRNAGVLGASVAAGLDRLGAPALAQEKFPAREVTWLIYQAPGGSIDTTARIIQPYLEKQGVKTTLEYALGAGGRVARSKLHSARPDGYMMMTESAPGGAIDEVIGRAGYKASEFIPVYGWNVVSWQLCVKKDSPLRTFQQFVDECRKRRVVVGTIGRAGSSHIQLAALQKELNLPFGLVHFDGSGKAYPAVMGGHVDAAISGPASGSRMRESLHFLAVTGAEREKALPDVPTLIEQGFQVSPIDQIWYAMVTPKVPEERVAALSGAFAKAFEDKQLWEQMQKAGEYLKLLTRPQIEELVKKQAEAIERYKDLLGQDPMQATGRAYWREELSLIAGLLLFFIAIVALALRYPFDARLFPLVIGSAGILLMLVIAVDAVRRRRSADAASAAPGDPAARSDWPRFATALLSAPAFGLLFWLLGFIVASLAAMLLMPLLMGYANRRRLLLLAVVTVGVLALLFPYLLNVDLPHGVLGNWLIDKLALRVT